MADKILHTHAQLKQVSAEGLVQDKVSDSKFAYTPEELKQADEHVGIIQLITGTTAKGEDFYAYVSVHPSLYQELVQKMMDGERMNVEKFGKVLKKGYGKQPSDEVKKHMEKTFGVDHKYMQHVTEEIEKLQKAKEK